MGGDQLKSGKIEIFWSEEDQEYVAKHSDYPSLSFLANLPAAALEGLLAMLYDVEVQERLEYLRSQIDAECISWGELYELQCLAEYIDPGDVQLLEWAGVPEFQEEEES